MSQWDLWGINKSKMVCCRFCFSSIPLTATAKKEEIPRLEPLFTFLKVTKTYSVWTRLFPAMGLPSLGSFAGSFVCRYEPVGRLSSVWRQSRCPTESAATQTASGRMMNHKKIRPDADKTAAVINLGAVLNCLSLRPKFWETLGVVRQTRGISQVEDTTYFQSSTQTVHSSTPTLFSCHLINNTEPFHTLSRTPRKTTWSLSRSAWLQSGQLKNFSHTSTTTISLRWPTTTLYAGCSH